jgi:hypothetical protein
MHKYLMGARTGVNDRSLARNVFYYGPREIQINPCTCIREADANKSLRLMMKLAISVMTAISLSLTSTALADHYNDLVVQGYRGSLPTGPIFAMLRKMFDNLSLTVPMPQSLKRWKTSIATTSYRELSFR